MSFHTIPIVRQRLINLMYLVLIAMLALNVSADVLDVFPRIDTELEAVVRSSDAANREVYDRIAEAALLQGPGAEQLHISAQCLRGQSGELRRFIDSLKLRMLLLADGADGKSSVLRSRDNRDAAGQVMLIEDGERRLREKVGRYGQTLSDLIEPQDSLLRCLIRQHLLVVPDEDIYEALPLAGVFTLLEVLRSGISRSEYELLRYLYSGMDAAPYRFQRLEALVIPEATDLYPGDEFRARIVLVAMDGRRQPEVFVNGGRVPTDSGSGIYTEKAAGAGRYPVEGIIRYTTPSGEVLSENFETEYRVIEPLVALSPLKMNVFYKGVDNPIVLAVAGIPSERLDLEVTNAQLRRENRGYVVIPQEAGADCRATVYLKTEGRREKVHTQVFRVKEVPDPVIKIAGLKGGKIRRNRLLSAGCLSVDMEHFDFDVRFEVRGFELYTIKEGYIRSASSDAASFSREQLHLIRNLESGQLLVVDKLIACDSDGKKRVLPPVAFYVE